MKMNSSVWSVIIFVFFSLLMLTCKKEPAISVPELTTTNFSSVTATSFICGGNITSDGGAPIISRGVCWSTGNNPTIADNKTLDGAETGVFASSVTGLTPEKTYYFRVYATNSSGTAYGNTLMVMSLPEESLRDCLQAFPGIKGENVTTMLNGNTVICNNIKGILFFQGDIAVSPEVKAASIDNKKYRWSDDKVIYTISSDFPDKNRISDSFKEFEKTNIVFKERTNESNYIEFKYIKDAGCYSYIGMIGGKQDIVIDNWGKPADIAHEIGHALGLLHEQSKSTRDQYVIIIPGNIESDQAHNFDIYPNSLNTPDFDFNSLMLYSSWAFSIQYGVKPTITKKDGSTFVPQREHFTNSDISLLNQLYPSLPEVKTSSISSIISSNATCGGEITSDKGSAVTERGICWSTSQNPTIKDNKTNNGSGTGNFTSNLTGLNAITTYYVRAYAINSVGTAYGDQVTFTTPKIETHPIVGGELVTNISQNSATSGGWIDSDGGSLINALGVCWSTSIDPTINNNKTTEDIGKIRFSSTLTGLAPNTKYYVRAYATNKYGTGYGNNIGFTTSNNTENNTVTDIDGNVYHTVTIGTQVWLVENLKTTKYNDGTSVPNITDNIAWSNLKTPAFCWYDNNVSYKNPYGALYNWYTVNTGKLAPKGWHIPTNSEWTTLTNYLENNSYGFQSSGNWIAKSLASTSGWNLNSEVGSVGNDQKSNNRSGFSGLPGSFRGGNGAFGDNGANVGWWSLTEKESSIGYVEFLSYTSFSLYRSSESKTNGVSVRCIKD